MRDLRERHLDLLQNLGKLVQYAELSKRTGSKRDLKIGVELDEIMDFAHDLLSNPDDHNSFTHFVSRVVETDDEDRESLYHTLNLLHTGVVLAKEGYWIGGWHHLGDALDDLFNYGITDAIIKTAKHVAGRYTQKAPIGRLLQAKYSEVGLLRELIEIGRKQRTKEFGDTDADYKRIVVLRLMFRYGDFKSYLRSSAGEPANQLLSNLRAAGFNDSPFVSDHLSGDVLSRQETSLTSWEGNFDELIDDFREGKYDVFFVEYDVEGKEVLNKRMREKVYSLSTEGPRFSGRDMSLGYALNKVKVMLEHCKQKQKEKEARGKKVDEPLKELEERLENLQIQLEFGGRPTGGMLYSRIWHRVPEDLSRSDFMFCCASLNGDKEDLTLKAIYNPAFVYSTYFIQGVDSQLGFSILKAGTSEKTRVLRAISPYEANPAIRTALGETETYRFVLDTMIKTASDTNAEFLLIEDIDLKVRDEQGHLVKIVDGEVRKFGEEGYQQGEDIVIRYRNGEPCAPRSFRKFLEKTARKNPSITHGESAFEEIDGDTKLVEQQFMREGENHYSIQSARPQFESGTDYKNLTSEETKVIFDQGYKSQNGVITAFRINVQQYLAERDGIDLRARPDTIQGNPRL